MDVLLLTALQQMTSDTTQPLTTGAKGEKNSRKLLCRLGLAESLIKTDAEKYLWSVSTVRSSAECSTTCKAAVLQNFSNFASSTCSQNF